MYRYTCAWVCAYVEVRGQLGRLFLREPSTLILGTVSLNFYLELGCLSLSPQHWYHICAHHTYVFFFLTWDLGSKWVFMHAWQELYPLSHLLSSLMHILNNLQVISKTECNVNAMHMVAKLCCLKND